MTQADIYSALNDIFCDLFLLERIQLESSTSALDIDGWDSFRHIELILAIEMKFSVRFGSHEIDAMRNVGDLVDMIDRHLRAN